ncbi:hypothetical protein NBRC116495_00580 [Aurantivibrio plasticivorans]
MKYFRHNYYGDKAYYDVFRNTFANTQDVTHDNYFEYALDGRSSDYVISRIKEYSSKFR